MVIDREADGWAATSADDRPPRVRSLCGFAVPRDHLGAEQ